MLVIIDSNLKQPENVRKGEKKNFSHVYVNRHYHLHIIIYFIQGKTSIFKI
jgi:hypothetical protein